MMRIIQRIDQQGDEAVDVVQLQHASAAEVVRIVNSLYTGRGAAAEGAGMPQVKIIADERTNSVLISGENSQRLRLKTLVAHLDTPLADGRRHAGALPQLRRRREDRRQAARADPGHHGGGHAAGGAGGAAPRGRAVALGRRGDKSVTIWAEPQTNALVVTAPPKVMRSVMAIVDRLDIRRAQVLVEAILVEMSADKAMDLGVNWLIADTDSNGNSLPAGGFVQPVDGTGIGQIIQGVLNPEAIAGLPSGLTMGLGQIVNERHELGRGDPRRGRHRQHQHHRDALDRHARQRRGRDQDRAGSAVRHRPVHEPGHPRHRRPGQPVPDHPARGSRQHPQDHAADQRRQLGPAQDLAGSLEHRGQLAAGQHERPDHQQAHDHHQRHGRGRRHHRARRPDLGRGPREQVAGAVPGLDPDHRRTVQDPQRRQGEDQPDGLHPPAHPARRHRRRHREQRQVQLHPQAAGSSATTAACR